MRSSRSTLHANPALAQSVGLTTQNVTDLNTIASNTAHRYDAVVNQAPAHGWTSDADVIARAQAYIATEGPHFHKDIAIHEARDSR